MGADLYDDLINSVSRKPLLEIRARGGVPGHAFIAVGSEYDNGFTHWENVFGLYPDGDETKQIKMISGVTGEITLKWEDMAYDHAFRASLDDEQREKAVEIMNIWAANTPEYSLFDNNCNWLAQQILQATGLAVPADDPGSTFPASYVESIVRVNEP